MKIPLPFVVIGGISTAVVGYAVKELCQESDCFGWFDNDSNTSNSNDKSQTKKASNKSKEKKKKLKSFYTLRKLVLETSYTDFNELISKVQNLNAQEKENITLKDNIPSSKPYSDEIKQTSKELYNALESFNDIFKLHISKISSMIEVSDNYEAYSSNSQTIINNAIKLSNTIYDILAVDIIDEEGNITQDSKDLVEKCKGLMEEYVSEQFNKLSNIN